LAISWATPALYSIILPERLPQGESGACPPIAPGQFAYSTSGLEGRPPLAADFGV
jgi:hypothetical protein